MYARGETFAPVFCDKNEVITKCVAAVKQFIDSNGRIAYNCNMCIVTTKR